MNIRRASSSQEAAIRHRDGPALVLAGPGSGKTYVLTERLRFLTEECGIPPGNILVITFTNAAAGQMRERAKDLIPDKTPYMTFGTFHSVFFLILKHTFNLTSENILSASLKHRILTEIINKHQIGVNDRENMIADLAFDISARKNGSLKERLTDLSDEAADAVFNAYNERLKELRVLDFDDMIIKCRELFIKKPAVLERFREKYRYISVDEFQDVNSVQYETVCLLAGERDNLFVVGDDDQAIYGFRGSSPGIMQSFLNEHEGVKRYELFTNYRSSKNIVEASVRLIDQNAGRLKKAITPFDMTDGVFRVSEFKDRAGQVKAMAECIHNLPEGEAAGETVILLRTNALSGFYAEGLRACGISCRVKQKTETIYSGGVGKDILDYLRFSLGDDSRALFLNIMNKPERGISRAALQCEIVDIDRVITYYCDEPRIQEKLRRLKDDRKRLSKMRPEMAVHYVLNAAGYREYIKRTAGNDRKAYDAKMSVADELRERAKAFGSVKEWLDEIENGTSQKEPSEEGVLITTMHSSKGLEFTNVFIPDVNEGVIPSQKTILNSEEEEERRLFYVAMTRAKKRLFISCISGSENRRISPSRFLNELDR